MKLRRILLFLTAVFLLPSATCAAPDYASFVSAWNSDMEARVIDPSIGLADQLDARLVAQSDEIVGTETDPLKQVELIYQWVTSNIYYDFDAFTKETDTYHTAVDVLEYRRAECDGFSGLFQALVQAQNIPCITCKGYALGQGTTGTWDSNNYLNHEVNHNWNEVYIDGEWLRMDTTWDVNNAYTAGYFVENAPSQRWFRFSSEELDITRRIDARGNFSYDASTNSIVDTSGEADKASLSSYSALLAPGLFFLLLIHAI